MIIIGVDFHPEFQQIAFVDSNTGEFQEKRLVHREGSGAVLSWPGGCGPAGAGWDGGQRTGTLVRTTAVGASV